MTAPNLADELDADQKLMIDIIYLHYANRGTWPIWRYVRRSFTKESSSDPRIVRDSFPVIGHRGSPGPSYSAIHFPPFDLGDSAEFKLCLAAGLHHPKYRRVADTVADLIQFFAQGVKSLDPDADDFRSRLQSWHATSTGIHTR